MVVGKVFFTFVKDHRVNDVEISHSKGDEITRSLVSRSSAMIQRSRRMSEVVITPTDYLKENCCAGIIRFEGAVSALSWSSFMPRRSLRFDVTSIKKRTSRWMNCGAGFRGITRRDIIKLS